MALLFVLALVRITMVVTLWTFEKYYHCSFFYEVTHGKNSFSVFDIIINIFAFEKHIRVISFSQTKKKDWGRMDTYIIWLSPFPVHLELSQHCLATPWMIAGQAPLSMGFPREEYWSGLTFPLPWDLPEPRIEPATLVFQGDRPSGKPQSTIPKYKIESKKSSVALGVEIFS